MPTASSAQIKNNERNIIIAIIMRCLVFVIFLKENSITNAVVSNKIPATTKSKKLQFTSLVNCIAINGISNKQHTIENMIKSVLGLGNMLIFIYYYKYIDFTEILNLNKNQQRDFNPI